MSAADNHSDNYSDDYNEVDVSADMSSGSNSNYVETTEYVIDDLDDVRFALKDVSYRLGQLESILKHLKLAGKDSAAKIVIKKTTETTEKSIHIEPKREVENGVKAAVVDDADKSESANNDKKNQQLVLAEQVGGQLATLFEEQRQMIVREAANQALQQVSKFIEEEVAPVVEKLSNDISYLQYTNAPADEFINIYRKACTNQVQSQEVANDMLRITDNTRFDGMSDEDIEKQIAYDNKIMVQKTFLAFNDEDRS